MNYYLKSTMALYCRSGTYEIERIKPLIERGLIISELERII